MTKQAIRHVQTEKKLTPDEALMRLHDIISARHAPKPGSFTTLTVEGRREYFREKRQESRTRARKAQQAGNYPITADNIRAALSDAAIMILATDAPGSAEIRSALTTIFAKRPGAPFSIEKKIKSGRLRPKLMRLRDA